MLSTMAYRGCCGWGAVRNVEQAALPHIVQQPGLPDGLGTFFHGSWHLLVPVWGLAYWAKLHIETIVQVAERRSLHFHFSDVTVDLKMAMTLQA